MPVGFNSPARNLFLLGSSGAQVVSNFFENFNAALGTTDGFYNPRDISYISSNKKYALAGYALDSNFKPFGWLDRQDYDLETGTLTTDYSKRIEATTPATELYIQGLELDANDNLIVAGQVGLSSKVPFISKYSNDGVLQWQSTTNTGEVRYNDVTSDSNGNYYACGEDSNGAFLEKFDGAGSPSWGKSVTAFGVGRSVDFHSVDCNNRGQVVAVGVQQSDDGFGEELRKGYVAKYDMSTGELLWDKTIQFHSDPAEQIFVFCYEVFIDSKDQIYVCGTVGTSGFLIKYTAEGNVIWQKQTESGYNVNYFRVRSDGETEQTVVFGKYNEYDVNNNYIGTYGLLTKYTKNGDVVWRRILNSSTTTNTFDDIALDADPSFYYLLFTDESNFGAGTPKGYTFGKVSTSGNGLGDFQYDDGRGQTIDYEIVTFGDEIARLYDGSVRNDSSDLITYPFSANKLLFDDFATHVANKKPQNAEPDVFEYSGSPAIRPQDFQELNLLGDTGIVASTTTGSAVIYSDDVSATNGFNHPAVNAFDGSTSTRMEPADNSVVTYAPSPAISVSTSMRVYTATAGSVIDSDFKINGRGLGRYIDSGTGWKNITVGPVYSTMLTGSTVKTPEGGFNPPHTMQQAGDRSEGVGGLTFTPTTPIPYSSSVEVYDNNNVTHSRVNSGTFQQHATNGWVTLESGSGTINSMFFQRTDNAAWDAGFVAIRVDGTILEDGVETLNTIELEHRSGAASTELFAVEIDGTILTDGAGLTVVPGSWVDQSGKGNSGTVNGATHNAAGWWEFDDAGNNIEIGTLSYDYSQLITLEAWIRTTDGGTWNQIVCGESGDILWAVNSGKLNFGSQTNTPIPHDNQSTATINTGNWIHVLTTYDGANIKHYINGELDSTFAETGSLNANEGTHPLRIGARGTGTGEFYGGDIGEVRIYPRALTAAQVFQNYNATKPKYLNEAPSIAPKIGPGIVYGSNLLLNYDFGNRATYDSAENLIPKSDFTTPTWATNGLVYTTFDLIPSPIGTSDAAEMIASSANAFDAAIVSLNLELSTTYTVSAYVKQGTATINRIGLWSGTQWTDYIDVEWINGEPTLFGSQSGNPNYSFVNIGGGWWRFIVVVTTLSNDTTYNWHFHPDRSGTGLTAYIWGPQIEKGSTAGRYIKTYGTAITAPTTVKNLSSSSYTGTINGATFNTDGSFQFDGTDDDINTGLSWNPTNQFSFTMWFNLDALKEWHNLVDLFNDSTNRNFQLFVESDGDYRIFWGNTAGGSYAITGTVANTWYYGAFSCDGANGTLYRYGNGTTDSVSATAPAATYSLKPLVLGRRGDSSANGFVEGKIGEFQFYNRELTSAEILQNYNATRGKYGV